MKILSIETSCDDTAITIMEAKIDLKNRSSFKILGNVSNSQIKIHAQYGGVYPMMAKREHIKNLPILLEEVLKETTAKAGQAKLTKNKKPVDVIAVTYGPGLEPSLWSGIVFAKELANKWNVPLIPVNHMEGHILSVFGKHKGKFVIPEVESPILSLLVSGGHTELILTKKWPASTRAILGGMKYEIIGETLDDAAGEAYDKVARMMNLDYPGGPKISKLAEIARKETIFVGSLSPRARGALPLGSSACETPSKNFSSLDFGKDGNVVLRSLGRSDGDGQRKFSAENFCAEQNNMPVFSLPRPMLYSKNFNFSFSGLKTAVLYLIKKIGTLNEETKSKIALEFENAVVETLVYKTIKAKEKYKAKTIIVAGGVACNKHLQREMKKAIGKNAKLLFPEKELTGDNSIMIGIAGYLNYIKNKKKVPKLNNIKATGNLRL